MDFSIKKIIESAGNILKMRIDNFNIKKAVPVYKENITVEIMITNTESNNLENVTEFWFKPSENIRISKVEISLPGFEDSILGDESSEYKNNQWYLLVGYEGIEIGQKWQFIFYGTVVGKTNQFSSIVKCEID